MKILAARTARWGALALLLSVCVGASALEVRGVASCTAGVDSDTIGLHTTDFTFGLLCEDRSTPGLKAFSDAGVVVDSTLGQATLVAHSYAIVEVLNGSISARGSAGAFMEVHTIISAPPPFMPDFLPVDLMINGRGDTKLGSQAAAHLVDPGGHLLFNFSWEGNDKTAFEDALHIFIEPGGGFGFGKGVSCISRAQHVAPPAEDIPSTDCFVSFDPIPVFDQARFDATWGDASFPLDQYFALFPAAAVPELPTHVLWVAGLGALAFAARRRVNAG